MQPLPLLFRRIVSWIFFVLFAVILLVVSVYASGYRLGEEFSLERTGGIHVSVPLSGAILYLGGEEVGTASFLDKSFFLDNLNFGTHNVSVEKEGYRTWNKTLIVERAYVTDTSAFLIPESITPLAVVVGDDTLATTTRQVAETQFEALVALFEEPQDVATTTVDTAPLESIAVALRDGNVYVRWNRNLDYAPSAFCITPRACVVEISVELDAPVATRAEFFQSGVVYQTENGIYLSEIDVKQPRMVVPLYEKPGAEFRVHEGEVVVRDGEDLFVVSF